MIAFLRGKVFSISQGSVILDVSGVGYQVFCPQSTLNKLALESEVLLHTAQILREDASSLYGFLEPEELSLFHLLGSVNGVGPKSALAILSDLGVSGVHRAVSTADDAMFKSVSGIGPKTAKLIVLTLTGKLILDDSNERQGSSVLNGLVNLGYQEKAARAVIDELLKESPELEDKDLLKRSLNSLSKARPGN